MDISALNCRITFQKSVSECDEVGNYTLQWENYFSCYATISNPSGGENEKGDVSENESLSFTVRYCKKATAVNSSEYRISFNDKTYNIKYVDLMGLKKKSIKFKTELVG